MTQIEVPEYKGRRFSPMGYKPSKQEQKNLRYWKAKQAKRKPITREEARRKEQQDISLTNTTKDIL